LASAKRRHTEHSGSIRTSKIRPRAQPGRSVAAMARRNRPGLV